ncbi:ArsC family reductase [Paraglaciecola sp. MB-3u-78]|uniref:ArsC family reductase n=1 Tax=Paraglaciecola sp. MB-3u-78 TaxID=2058332 RepID=UPI000C345AC3|nr:ArsC family reductase [Paraglaciecola sp. MB-3u-78]PKG99207.1 ArsC family reductase [Paraglaciecola sp. MB-3u-78]
MTTLYGIKNCDTIKKARAWLSANNIDYIFHDYRQDGLDTKWLEQTEQTLGWELMLNKRGTTFRQLSEEQKQGVDKMSALALMLEYPAMIKRPILIHNDEYFIGFKAEQFAEVFS